MAEHNQQFDSYEDWVENASGWLTRGYRYDSNGCPINRAVCFDAKGRLVECGGHFRRAQEEDAFPVRWLWPDQIAEIGNQHPFFGGTQDFLSEALNSGDGTYRP